MEVIFSKEQIQGAIKQHFGDRCHGIFVTLDTPHTTDDITPSKEFFERLERRYVVPYTDAVNHFCYGRSFSRGSNCLKTIAAIEIGEKTNRYHMHLVMLHKCDTARTLKDLETRSRMIWEKLAPKSKKSFVDVQPFDITRNWLHYTTKSFTTLKLKYDFSNVRFH